MLVEEYLQDVKSLLEEAKKDTELSYWFYNYEMTT